MKKMKKILFPILLLLLNSCAQPIPQNSVNISVVTNNVSGFNIQNFTTLLRTTKDPQSLEQDINVPNNNINNLDLDKNGQVDYLKVVETQSGVFQVDDASIPNQIVVATLTIVGNQNYSGGDYMYNTHFTVGDYLLLSYIMRPHPYYVPSYHYGYYPSYYHHTTVRTVYRNNNNTIRSATPVRNSLSNPNQSQRSFTPRAPTTPVRSGGFGTPKPATTSGFGSSSSARHFGSGGGFGHSSSSGHSGFGHSSGGHHR
jgi:uncharacterized membrane protein YgcG